MKIKIFKKLIVVFLISLALILRLWDLPNNPPGLTWDEAALGYNAYSLLKTGRDEYGTFMPANLTSFGDDKPAIYAYLTIPFVAIFGLNELAVRLPSALAGVMSVVLSYLIIRRLFKSIWTGFLAALMLAISPYMLQFSRPAFEANLALMWNLFAVWAVLKVKENQRWWLLAGVSIGLSMFTYQSSRLFWPLMLMWAAWMYRLSWWGVWRQVWFKVSAAIIGITFSLLIMTVIIMGQGNRLAALNVFSYDQPTERVEMLAREHRSSISDPGFEVLHGQWWADIRGLFERGLIYFSPKVWWVEGDSNQRSRVPDLGILAYYSILLLPLGLYWLIRHDGRLAKLILGWWLIAVIPAMLSRDLLNSLRSLNTVWPISILEALGIVAIFESIQAKKIWLKIIVALVVGGAIFANGVIYLDRYYLHAPISYDKYWLSAYRPMYQELNKLELNKYSRVRISDGFGQPYIYYLFYQKYDPSKYQQMAKLDQSGVDVGSIKQVDKLEFGWIDYHFERFQKNSLIVATESDISTDQVAEQPNWKILSEIKFANGQIAFRVIEIP